MKEGVEPGSAKFMGGALSQGGAERGGVWRLEERGRERGTRKGKGGAEG